MECEVTVTRGTTLSVVSSTVEMCLTTVQRNASSTNWVTILSPTKAICIVGCMPLLWREKPRFKSQLCHLLVLFPSVIYLNSLSLSFLIIKVEIWWHLSGIILWRFLKNERLKQYLTYRKPELKDCNKNNLKTYSVVIRKPAFIQIIWRVFKVVSVSLSSLGPSFWFNCLPSLDIPLILSFLEHAMSINLQQQINSKIKAV